MEEIMEALRKIQKDIDAQKNAIQDSVEIVTEKVSKNINTILDEKFETWHQNQVKIKEQIEDQEQRLNLLEKQARKRNIVFFGIEDNEKSYFDVENKIINFINDYFSLNLNCDDIQEVRRVGKKSEKPRPITVTFVTLSTKIKIMKQKMVLKNTNYYIKEDYPTHVLEKRRMLQEQLKVEREKGNNVIIKYDKIVIVNKPEAKDTRKRHLSTSPQHNENTSNRNISRNSQVSKKNKTFLTCSASQRSSSLSEGTTKQTILNYLSNKKDKSQERNNI